MRVELGVAELGGDPLGQLVREHVLEQLRLLVHEVPGNVEHLHQQQLQQPVVAQRAQRDAAALGGQRDAAVALVLEQPELVEPAQHSRHRAGRDAEPLGQRVRRHRSLQPRLERVDRLEVVLDGAGSRGRCVHARQRSAKTGFGLAKTSLSWPPNDDRGRPRAPRAGAVRARADARPRPVPRPAGAAGAGVRRRGRVHRSRQLRDQHRGRREVRLPARLGDRRRQPHGDARAVPVGQGRHRDRPEPAGAVPGAPAAAGHVGPVGAGGDHRDRHRSRRVRRGGHRAQPAVRRTAVRRRPDHRGRRVRHPRAAAARLPALRAGDRRLPRRSSASASSTTSRTCRSTRPRCSAASSRASTGPTA